MRHVLVAAILLVSTAALANPKEIEKVAKSSITALAGLQDNSALGFSSDAVVIGNDGSVIDMKSEDGCVRGSVANAFYGCFQGSVTHKPGTAAAGSDGDIGWFQAPYTAIIDGENPEGGPSTPEKRAVRFGGVVKKTGSSWEIIAGLYVDPIPDKALLARPAGTAATGNVSPSGQKKIALLVAGWFTTGFANAAAKKVNVIASGTSPTEFKSGAAAVTLAKSWDKLKLKPKSVDAKVIADGKVAWVRAEVEMPKKGGKGVITMTLVAVLVPSPVDGPNDWRWVSLMYQP